MKQGIPVIVFDYTSDGVIKITQGNKEELVTPNAPFLSGITRFCYITNGFREW